MFLGSATETFFSGTAWMRFERLPIGWTQLKLRRSKRTARRRRWGGSRRRSARREGSGYDGGVFAQPVDDVLTGAKNVLLAGCGGGYDILGAVPLYADLVERGCNVHLASLSFTYLNGLDGTIQSSSFPNLYEVPSAAATSSDYCPEAWLARFLEERSGRPQSVWAFDKTGVRPLAAAYEHLVEKLGIDTLILIDGGIDALLRGDETSLGTPAEDLSSVAAARLLRLPRKVLACVGLGAEIRDGIQHEQVFARIAELGRAGGFLGSASILPGTKGGALYMDAVEYVFANQQGLRNSHVHKVVLAAMRGEYGSDGPYVWLSPLLNVFWFFGLDAVADTHLFLPKLAATESVWDVTAIIEPVRHETDVRKKSVIPI